MKTIIFIISVFTITLASGQLLNRQCNSDQDCSGSNWVCEDRKCKCGVGFRQGNQQDCVSILGSTCEARDECENLPGATCENNKCICKAGQIAGSKECVKIGQEGEECFLDSDCIHRTSEPDNEKECKNSFCMCKLGKHQGNDKRCKRSLGLQDDCTYDDDCFQADTQNNNALECIESDQVKKCKCKEGYKEEGDKCNGSATQFILSASSLLLVVMAILKM